LQGQPRSVTESKEYFPFVKNILMFFDWWVYLSANIFLVTQSRLGLGVYGGFLKPFAP